MMTQTERLEQMARLEAAKKETEDKLAALIALHKEDRIELCRRAIDRLEMYCKAYLEMMAVEINWDEAEIWIDEGGEISGGLDGENKDEGSYGLNISGQLAEDHMSCKLVLSERAESVAYYRVYNPITRKFEELEVGDGVYDSMSNESGYVTDDRDPILTIDKLHLS